MDESIDKRGEVMEGLEEREEQMKRGEKLYSINVKILQLN